MTIGKAPMCAFILFVIVVTVTVYFMRLRDRRRAPLSRIFEVHETIHSVGPPDTPVTACVRTMASEKIGALVVMNDERFIGISTERDALIKVLASNLVDVAKRLCSATRG